MKWRCRSCGTVTEIAAERTMRDDHPPGFEVRLRDGVTVTAVLHRLDYMPGPERGICGACDPIPDAPDELEKVTVEVMQGQMRAAIVRCLPPEPAARVLDVFETQLKWGQSVDHETQETYTAIVRLIGNAVAMLPPHPASVRKSRLVEQVRNVRALLSEELHRHREERDPPPTPPTPAGSRLYQGFADGRVMIVHVDPHGSFTEHGSVPRRLDLRRHSPDGFSWGYSGSGPAQLALAILASHFRLGIVGGGMDPESLAIADERALAIYQRFKNRVISRLPREQAWTLSTQEIDEAVAEIESAPAVHS